ncbi:hypothetical protein [Streptomyces sp. NPDC086023]|uniref:hypothetical protein n=1 Tax=Streptomyces sp. NPDC086023 TaxID=3365746 RepID=UPI0037D8CEFE
MSKYTPRAQMTPQQRTSAQRNAKRRRFLVQRGTPSRSKDIAEIQQHLRRMYYDGGMTSHAMAAQSGVSRDTIMHVIKGHRRLHGREVPVTCLLRSTIDKLWTIELQLPPDASRSGAHLPPLGTRRRLQALNALGYDGVWMAKQLGVSEASLTAMLSDCSRRYVYAATARRVASFYEQYQHTDPADAGRSAWHIATTKSRAAKKGYAPPACWDDDAIDSPQAEPEWTGACGSAEGYAIHRREGIPACRPCRRARYAYLQALRAESGTAAGAVPTETAAPQADAARSTVRRLERIPVLDRASADAQERQPAAA